MVRPSTTMVTVPCVSGTQTLTGKSCWFLAWSSAVPNCTVGTGAGSVTCCAGIPAGLVNRVEICVTITVVEPTGATATMKGTRKGVANGQTMVVVLVMVEDCAGPINRAVIDMMDEPVTKAVGFVGPVEPLALHDDRSTAIPSISGAMSLNMGNLRPRPSKFFASGGYNSRHSDPEE